MKQFEERMKEIKFKEVWEIRNKEVMEIDRILEDCMEGSGILAPSDSNIEYFSPLILSLLESTFAPKFFKRLTFIVDDERIFCQLLQLVSEDQQIREWTDSVLGNLMENLLASPAIRVHNKATVLSEINMKLFFPLQVIASQIKEILLKCDQKLLLEVLPILLDHITSKTYFNPFESRMMNYNKAVLVITEEASKLSLSLDPVVRAFEDVLKRELSAEVESSDCESLLGLMKLLPISQETIHHVLTTLLDIPVQEINPNPTLLTILTGIWSSLSLAKMKLEEAMFSKLLCIVEVLLASEANKSMVDGIQVYNRTMPEMSSYFGCNFVKVLLKNPIEANIELAKTLIMADKKHNDSVKSFICQEKLKLDHRVLPLVKLIMEDRSSHMEKKFITVVLRQVVGQIEAGEQSEELLDMVRVLSSQAAVTCSDKQSELWRRAAGDKRDSEQCMGEHHVLTMLRTQVLVTLQTVTQGTGGLDTRLMRECMLPLLHHVADNIKTSPETVSTLCRTITICQNKIENKIYLKEFQKISSTLWPQFYRSVLKYSLRPSSSPSSVGCSEALALLADICQFLNYGDKLSDAETIYQMVSAHSGYLGVMSRPGCDTKTALVQLLLALCPYSCDADQVR